METMVKYRKKWQECGRIVGNNFKKQREHVHDVFYSMAAKEKLSRDEFKNILHDIRDSWKEVTTKTEGECIALLEEPVVSEVKFYIHTGSRYTAKGPGYIIKGFFTAETEPWGQYTAKGPGYIIKGFFTAETEPWGQSYMV
ncbi:hypothetical protein AK88_05634 [Plasmodium fragile]|uniref:Plasmodium RESA N-terminal domain-containing protein n=1 Tax=Plasmodium fragile TaxID=5857 RepID=A0A0D9QCK3_PLAFR|nr:uncharacterized protein AK88_05634 [Plasmodium fragile]KJP84733.1 hypothetical protein AK88_05634 [Plasmodium fragile]